ncbi:MAG: zinc ribbon domain-containing protein [Rickettsiella sp.]|nr:zinc ribbon domain-containing protein [Rickettsiella sp.]
MPIYEYQCDACGHHFDTIQSFKDEALIHCPVCGEPSLKKLISAPAFHLKGTGWYETDFKNPAKPSAGTPESKGEVSKDKEKVKEDVKKDTNASKDTQSSTDTNTKKPDKSD